MGTMRVYISGKIGEEVLSDATRRKFAKAERELREWDFDVFNPTTSGLGLRAEELARQNGTDFYTEIMKLDLEALSWCDAIYLLLDHPDYSPMQCLRLSNEMMRGHKMELFTLDLSFLGWEILRWLLPPFAIWLWPYEALTFANYYRALAGEPIPAIPRDGVIEGEFTEVNKDDDDWEGWH